MLTRPCTTVSWADWACVSLAVHPASSSLWLLPLWLLSWLMLLACAFSLLLGSRCSDSRCENRMTWRVTLSVL